VGIADEARVEETVGEVWVDSVSGAGVAIDASLEMGLIPYKILEFFANLPTESNGSMLVYIITFEFISSRLSPYVIYINKAYDDLHQ